MKKARSEHRQKNRLEKLNTDLTDLDAKKNEFLSLATHQLRSPLTSIKWGLSSLKEKFSLNTVEHLLETTDDLISTVNDLLDISKIEQGGMVMKFEEFDLHDFVGRLAEEFRMTAEAKGLRLVFSGENTPCFVIADQNKLRQVFVNLIDNAVKYTKEGTIDVLFQKTSKEAIVSVSDTGPGISKEELSCLFDKFLRGAAGRASSGGSGLGLYLAKKIVQEHKGSIKANSKGLGYGSVFVVRLPIK
jgi:signal transduction histidine kinase